VIEDLLMLLLMLVVVDQIGLQEMIQLMQVSLNAAVI